jgi:hypothetical protein
MNGRRPSFFGLFLLTLTLCGSTAIVGVAPARADDVTEWNAIAIDVLALAGQNPVVMTRGLAMAHLAVHDALNAIDRRYEPYLYDRRSEPGAAPGAAVAAAMREVLIGALAGFGTPEQQAKGKERTDAAYAAALVKIPDGRTKQDGIGAGQAAAMAIELLYHSDRGYDVGRQAVAVFIEHQIRIDCVPIVPLLRFNHHPLIVPSVIGTVWIKAFARGQANGRAVLTESRHGVIQVIRAVEKRNIRSPRGACPAEFVGRPFGRLFECRPQVVPRIQIARLPHWNSWPGAEYIKTIAGFDDDRIVDVLYVADLTVDDASAWLPAGDPHRAGSG